MYCGDEIAGIVGDVGSFYSKFGYAGEDAPKHMFRSAAGFLPSTEGGVARETRKRKHPGAPPPDPAHPPPDAPAPAAAGQWFVGDASVCQRRDGVEVRGPLTDGLVTDWDLMEALWEHGYARLRAQPADWPAMCIESSWSTRRQRASCMELMLEGFGCPAMYIGKAGALAAFGAGRATALVCEIGHGAVSATPVVEGYVLNKSVRHAPRGAHWLAQETLRLLELRGMSVTPRFAVRAGAAAAAAGGGADAAGAAARALMAKTHPTFVRYWQEDVALDLVEACMRVPAARGWPAGGGGASGGASSAASEGASASEESSSGGEDGDAPASSYELPDGTSVQIDAELRALPGALFLPPPAAATAAAAAGAVTTAAPHLCVSALGASDGDVRKELASNIVLTGGGALLRGTPERLGHDVGRLLPGAFRVRVLAPLPVERRFGAWIGASVLCCLGTFQQMWLSKKEYEELGPDRADDRFGG